jgi:ABC-type sugar transport system substrate-binding protein
MTLPKAVVLTQDSDAPNSNRVAYIGTDNLASESRPATIKKALPDGGKIVLLWERRSERQGPTKDQAGNCRN